MRLFGISFRVDAFEENNMVICTGIRYDSLKRYVKAYYNSGTFLDKFVSRSWSNSLKFHKFFVPEFVFLLQNGIKEGYLPTYQTQKLIDRLCENTWYKDTFIECKSPVDMTVSKYINPDFKLTSVQLEFIRDIYYQKKTQYHLKGYLLALEQGLGKSFTSLFLAEALHKKHVIITCPLSVINSVWVNEIDKVFMTDRNHLVWTSDDDVSKLTVNTRYVIMNYESIGKMAPMLLKLFKGHESMVVIDEWHNFKDINSLRTNNLIDFCSAFKCNDILPMSGTPIKALGIETLPLFKLLDEYYNADVEARLKTMNKFTKVMNDLLCNRLGFTMYRKLKKDVLKDLPDKHEEDLPVTIPNGEYYTLTNVKKLVVEFTAERRIFYKEHFKEFAAIYEECLKLFEKTLHTQLEWNEYKTYLKNVAIIQKSGYGWDNIEYIKQANIYEKHVIVPGLPVNMRAKFKASKSVVKYVELKILGEVLGGLLNNLRAEMSAAMIGEEVLDKIRTADKKTILFSSYRDTIDVAKTVCVKNGMKPVIITGDNSREAGEIIKKFTEDDELNPLISSTKAVSVGHTIIIANTVIFLNTPYRSTDYDQASDRVYRIGQDTDVYIYKLVLDTGGEPNLSTRMHDIIAWSKEQFGTIMGDITDDDTGISNSEAKIKGIIDTANTEDTSTITNLLSGMYNNIKNKLTK